MAIEKHSSKFAYNISPRQFIAKPTLSFFLPFSENQKHITSHQSCKRQLKRWLLISHLLYFPASGWLLVFIATGVCLY
jgi:hypothetical protein